jgi:hypothetical protein
LSIKGGPDRRQIIRAEMRVPGHARDDDIARLLMRLERAISATIECVSGPQACACVSKAHWMRQADDELSREPPKPLTARREGGVKISAVLSGTPR